MRNNLYMKKIGKNAKIASVSLSNLSISKRNSVLLQFYKYLKIYSNDILEANKKDVLCAKKNK